MLKQNFIDICRKLLEIHNFFKVHRSVNVSKVLVSSSTDVVNQHSLIMTKDQNWTIPANMQFE